METLVPLEFVLRTYTHNTNSSMKRAHATIFEIHECVCAVYSFSWSETRAVSTALPRSLLLCFLLLLKTNTKGVNFISIHIERERGSDGQPLGGSCGCWIRLPVKWKAKKKNQKKKVLTGSEFFFLYFTTTTEMKMGETCGTLQYAKQGSWKLIKQILGKFEGRAKLNESKREDERFIHCSSI